MTFIDIIIGLIGISTIVAIHELGHLFAAKLCGIKVDAFSLGWGPRLFGKTIGGTEYRVSLLPLGGYVRMHGEEDMRSAILENKEAIEPSPGSFFGAAPWKRIIVGFAGPLANILFAILTFGILYMPGEVRETAESRIVLISDYPQLVQAIQDYPTVLYGPDSPARKAGLQSGDRIVAIDGKPVSNFEEVFQSTATAPTRGEDVLNLTVSRNNQNIFLQVRPVLNTKTGVGQIGISPWNDPVIRSSSGNAAQAGFKENDRVLLVNGKQVNNSIEVALAIKSSKGSCSFTILRDGIQKELVAFPEIDKDGNASLALSFKGILVTDPPLPFFPALKKGIEKTFDSLYMIVKVFKLFGQGLDPVQAVSGPVRTTMIIGDYTTAAGSHGFLEGLRAFFNFLAAVSIALFFGNLLPIPALDGGQIILYLIELIRRKPLSIKFIRRYNTVGFILVAMLIALAFYGDIIFLLKKLAGG